MTATSSSANKYKKLKKQFTELKEDFIELEENLEEAIDKNMQEFGEDMKGTIHILRHTFLGFLGPPPLPPTSACF